MQAKEILSGSIRSASYNIIYQVVSRVVTFILNAFTLHYISHDVLGIINVRLTLYYSTVIFISREAFRRACLSRTEDQPWPQVINLVWLVIPNCFLWCILFGIVWLHPSILVQPSTDVTAHYTYGVVTVGLSCVIEMLAIPLSLVAQAFFFAKLQVFTNTIFMLVRSVLLCCAVMWIPEKAVLAYGVGHILAAVIYTVSYYVYFWYFIAWQNRKKADLKKKDQYSRKDSSSGILENFPFYSLRDFLPQIIVGQKLLNKDMTLLTWSFFKQGLLKQVLTEGERYVMTVFNLLSFPEQGIYDVVANLSSLVVRFLFLPIEDSSYYYFAQMVKRDLPLVKQDKHDLMQVAKVLKTLLQFMTLVGLTFVVFGYSYSHLLLHLYGGAKLSDGEGTNLLRLQCFCVLFLAINGVTEAYVFACMSKEEINKYNHIMVILSMMFLFSSWGFTHLFGSCGFILANCFIMFARIIHSIHFINQHYRATNHRPLTGFIPSAAVGASLFLSTVVTYWSEITLYPTAPLQHFIVGCGCFGTLMLSIAFTQREMVKSVLEKIFKIKSKTIS